MMRAPAEAAFLIKGSAFLRVFSTSSQQLAIWALQHFIGGYRSLYVCCLNLSMGEMNITAAPTTTGALPLDVRSRSLIRLL
jgi:hypothetical protein